MIFASILLIASLVDVPLKSASDYVFTKPNYPHFISGKVMGTEGQPYTPLRGEDQTYLWEAWSEMDAISQANPTTVLTPKAGVDRVYLSKAGSRVGAVWHRIYDGLAANTNTQYDTGRLIKRNSEIVLTQQLYPYVRSGGQFVTKIARDAVLASSSAAKPTEGMRPLGVPLDGRALISTNVAAFYSGLLDIAGIANDFTAPNSTNINKTTSRSLITEATFNSETGEFEYSSRASEGTGAHTGGGLYETTLTRTSVMQKQFNGSSRFSSPMQSDAIYSFEAEDILEVPLFTNSFAKSSQLFALNGWVVSSVSYTDFLTTWTTPTNTTVIGISTNAMVASEAVITIFERDGMVYAKAKPDYDNSYKAFLSKTGL